MRYAIYLKNPLMSVLAVLWLLGGQNALAVPVALTLSDGSVTVTCADGDPLCDSNPLAGAVTYTGSVGGWLTNITTALTAPVLGTADHAVLHMDNVSLSSSAGGTISIMASASGFTGPITAGGAPMSAALGGVTAGHVDARFYLDDSNALFGHGSLIAHLDSAMGVSGSAFAASAGRVVSPANAPFSLTIATVVSHSAGGATSFDAQIPEPPVVALWLLGLGLLVLVRQRASRASGSLFV